MVEYKVAPSHKSNTHIEFRLVLKKLFLITHFEFLGQSKTICCLTMNSVESKIEQNFDKNGQIQSRTEKSDKLQGRVI